jgi:uncharacterized protein YjiS (DUF1127 family)
MKAKQEMEIVFEGRRSRAPCGRVSLAAVFGWLRLCLARRQERIDLNALSDHQLRDLGLTRNDAAQETARRAWHGLDRR